MTPDQLARNLSAAASEFKPATELLRNVGRVLRVSVRGKIRARAYKTGRLHDSANERVLGDTLMFEVTAPYAGYVDTGTRYMDGRHFMRDGTQDAMPDIEREMQLWGEGVLAKVAGR